ncbi:DUF3576 domain-containing protein [Antarcticimicrobium sediminis]|uniref:DUF3576 domain-containing protein n=1 Tax=Antarcticimicrobium sediminis TaxID=2546227 RepID=A0A4R5EN21_9RHOB|nr:DUF3576 domain-containing protein [Antarcticimicrobium sediminis]TDE35988.1 DUF3576 domain-containing protein [Antarcticimicrobium sediminis]
MTFLKNPTKVVLIVTICLAAASCSRGPGRAQAVETVSIDDQITHNRESAAGDYERSSIWDLFGGGKADTRVQVNRYLWSASLDVLDFLPVQSVDPFTGVITTGYGTPPGGGRAYRATIHISDPALDARSLKVALQTKGGTPVSAGTARAVEDAILTRARQLRVRDKRL